MKEATIVHHILPKEIYPEYAFEDWNLISVSYDTHARILHNYMNGELTKKGEMLMKETAFLNGIKLQETILVIGLPRSGKTTYVKANLGEGMCYDLDYIAGAFRLRQAHAEMHDGARTLANRFLKGFVEGSKQVANKVFIIRTAPSIEQVANIMPDRLVVCDYNDELEKEEKSKNEMATSIYACIDWCSANNIIVEKTPPR